MARHKPHKGYRTSNSLSTANHTSRESLKFRLSALNEESNDEPSRKGHSPAGTKEAQEAHAFGLYNYALQLQQDQHHTDAIKVYDDLLKTSLVIQAETTLVDENGEATENPLKDPGLILKYSTHKNMASILAERGDITAAMEHYLKAVMLDTTDVTLWLCIGTHAITLGRLALARHAFTSGLKCNEDHWPCLDSAITVLYALLDYENCLYWIAKALEKDPEYMKGLALREKMYAECPHLRGDSQDLFRHCDLSIYDADLDDEEADEHISEALRLREQHRKLCKSEPPKLLTLNSFKKLSWVNIGEQLLSAYNLIMEDKNFSFASPISFGDIEALKKTNTDKEQIGQQQLIDIETVDENDVTIDNLEPATHFKHADKETTSSDATHKRIIDEDESSNVSQSAAEDSACYSEDSVTSAGGLAATCNTTFTHSFALSQDIPASQDSEESDTSDIVYDVMNNVLQQLVSEEVRLDSAVAAIVQNLVDLVTESATSVQEIVRDLVDEVVEKVDRSVTKNRLKVVAWNTEKETQNEQEDVVERAAEAVDGGGEEKNRKTSRRKKFSLDSAIEDHTKRRSNRVRVSSKRRQHYKAEEPAPIPPSTDYKLKIKSLLPKQYRNLLCEDLKGEVLENKDLSDPLVNEESTVAKAYNNEKDDVLDFIESNESNLLIEIMQNYCFSLCEKIHVLWEKGTCEKYVKVFFEIRPHFSLPNPTDDVEPLLMKNILFSLLTYVECFIDSRMNDSSVTNGALMNDVESCLCYLGSASTHHHLFKVADAEKELHEDRTLNRDWKAFGLRFLWARVKHNLILENNQSVTGDLETCKEILQKIRTNPMSDEFYVVEDPESYKIALCNMEHHSVISLANINKRLRLLEQAEVLESANKCFAQERYDEVVSVLKPTMQKRTCALNSKGDRPRQIRQFLISCQHTSYLKAIFTYTHLLDEAKSKLILLSKEKVKKKSEDGHTVGSNNAKNDVYLKQWNETLHTFLLVLDRALTENNEGFKKLDLNDRSLLVHAVIDVLCFLMSRLTQGRSSTDVVLSWIIIYKILVCDERDDVEVLTNCEPPPSFLLLNTAHELMSKKNCCCSAHGKLLKFTISQILARFNGVQDCPYKDEIDCALQQCFFCLYAYPSKTKPRTVQDHGARQVELTWKDFLLVFRHFRPEIFPEFDSLKTFTISLDFSLLLLQALDQAPNLETPNSEDVISTYIEGGCVDSSILKQSSQVNKDLHILSDMYYFLADFYFKNNEMTKAVKYYLLDLKINPERFDSWAGLALARSSQTDDGLRMCETKKSHQKQVTDSATERRGIAALSCFKRALSFDSSSVKLWIEYGSLAYWMHSVYSRKIKRRKRHTEEDTTRMKEMLRLSRLSFENVMEIESDEINDEEWLVNYMLGKICEKEGKPLKVFIKFYQTAAMLLHRRHAKYPKRIQAKYGYANDLAIEALEMYFRVHASVLKYILANPKMSQEDLSFMKDVVEEMSNSPFAKRAELKSAYSSLHEQDKTSKLTMPPTSSDLTMGSLLPDSILQALNIEDTKADDDNDTSSTLCSNTQHSGEQSKEAVDAGVQTSSSVSMTISITEQVDSLQQALESNDKRSVPAQSEESRQADCDHVIDACEAALRLCVRRFQLHNKAVYRLAHLYAKCEARKHLVWSRDLLYGSSTPWQQLRHMSAPGLLSDRNKTNLFNGVWRLPMDEIDRPGSFAAHLYRCLALLLDVLRELNESDTLRHIHNLLHRTPEHGKKYLREEDRIELARRALVFCRGIIHRKILSLSSLSNSSNSATIHEDSCQGTTSPKVSLNLLSDFFTYQESQEIYRNIGKMQSAAEDSLSVLMDAYKVYQDTQKHNDVTTSVDTEAEPDDMTHQRLLADAYHRYTCITRNSPNKSSINQNLLEEAIKFCQQHNASKKSTQSSSNTKPTFSTKQQPLPSILKPVPRTTSPGYRRHESLAAVKEVKELSIDDDEKVDNSANYLDKTSSNMFKPVIQKSPQGKVTMVEKEGKTYTRIGLPRSFAPSPNSAFRSTAYQDGVEGKRLRVDPGLRHLQDPTKNRLIRSTSVPVYPEGEENTPPHHRPLYRTGSFVSDSTKLKLKSAILAKTSAALVRKPSITDLEMMQIQTDPDADSDSSQSEDEDEEIPEPSANLRKRKLSEEEAQPPVSSNEHSPLIPPHQPTVITTAGST